MELLIYIGQSYHSIRYSHSIRSTHTITQKDSPKHLLTPYIKEKQKKLKKTNFKEVRSHLRKIIQNNLILSYMVV